MPSALDAITDAIKKQKTDIALTVASIAMADSKWKAVAESVKWVAIDKMIGPLGIVLGMTTGLVGAFRAVLVQTGSLDAALRRIAQISGLEKQFVAITKNAALAKQRVAELIALSQRSPFDLGAWGQAGRALEILTRGAYSSGEALTTMGDAATATGNSLEEVAHATGALYEALREGEPAGAAAEQMRGMGLISEETARKVVTLQESGAAFSTTWGAVQGDLARTSGSMKEHMETVEGLQDAYQKAREALAQKFGAPFAQAELDNIRNGTTILKALAPVVEQVSAHVAQAINPISNFGTKIGAWVLSLGGVTTALVAATNFVVTFVGVIASGAAALGLWQFAQFIRGLASLAIGAATSGAATIRLGSVMMTTKVAAIALSEGNFALAASEAAIAARSAVATVAVRAFGLAMKAIPWIAIIATITEAIEIYSSWSKANEEAKETVDALHESTQQMISSLASQAAAISTLEDKTRALAAASDAVAEAYKEYYEIASKPMTRIELATGMREKEMDAAREKITAATNMREGIGGIGNLAPSQAEIATSRRRIAREEHLRQSAFQGAMARATPTEQIQLRGMEIRRLQSQAEAGETGLQGRARTERARAMTGVEISDAEANLKILRARAAALRKEGVDSTFPQQLAADRDVHTAADRVAALKARQEKLGSWSGSQALALMTQANMMQAGRDAAAATNPTERHRLTVLSGGLTGTPQEISALKERALRAEELEKAAPENADRAADMKQEQFAAEKELATTARRMEMETQIARLKSQGVDRADEEAAIKRKYLEAELKLEQDKGIKADPNVVSDLTNQISDHDRATAATDRSFAVTKVGLDRQLAQGAALRKGDIKAATKMGDIEMLASHFEELKGQGFNDELAQKYAEKMTGQDILGQANAADRGLVVDSMQKIAGGGGVEATDPVLTVAQRQADLQAEMVEYLKTIAASSGKGDTLDPEYSIFGDY